MPKITYPRPCPTCGKEISRGHFFKHKRQCGTTKNRYQCPLCPMSFSYSDSKLRHIRQQHSNNPPRFTCPECGEGFTAKRNMKLHLATVCAEVKPCYNCWFCSASYTRKSDRQTHVRRVHGGLYHEQDINLLLHLQHLSEESDCKAEWMFVESRPIKSGEHNICPCGQTGIKNYFFLENKLNGNRTYVGSACIGNIDPRVGKVIAYFQYILVHPIEGSFVENVSEGFQKFTVRSNTTLVKGADKIVKHLNPQVSCNLKGEWEVLVKYSKPDTLIQGQTYALRLKVKYVQGQLTFTAV